MKIGWIVLSVALGGGLLLSCTNEGPDQYFRKSTVFRCDSLTQAEVDRSALVYDDSVVLYSLESTRIAIQNLRTGTFRTINVAPGYSDIHAHSADSIFLFRRRNELVVLINTSGFDVAVYHIPRIQGKKRSLMVDPLNRPIVIDSMLFVTVYPHVRLESFYDYHFECVINLSDHSCRSFLRYPDMYSGDNWWHVMGNELSRVLGAKGELVYSFPMSEKLYCYDTDGAFLREATCPSKYLDTFPPPAYEEASKEELIRYVNTIPKFSSLKYDPFRKCYYRIAAHSQEMETEERVPNYNLDRPWSVVVLDEELHKIGEQAFPGRRYNYEDVIVSREGLLVANRERNEEDWPKTPTTSYTLFEPVLP